MITALRRSLDTLVVRGFFMIMVLSFVVWGVGDVLRLIGTSTWVVKAAGRTIEGPAFQMEFQRAMGAAARELPQGQEATAELRRKVGDETLRRLVGQAAIGAEIEKLRVVSPEASVLAMIRELPAFKGPDGKFSKPTFDMTLRNNGLSEARFLEIMRGDIAQRQLNAAVAAGASVSDLLLTPIYQGQYEKRSADMATFPLSAAADPGAPDDAALHRWYDNHPDLYATPEYRRIKYIELSPRTLAADVTLSDDDLKTWYDQHQQDFTTVAKRSAEILSASDEEKAKALAAQWRGGADWAAMQKAAEEKGAGAIALDDATVAQFPDPDLAKAVFAAKQGDVSEPLHGALGWFVIKVTAATEGGTQTYDQVKDTVKARATTDKALDMMYERANKIDNLLANGDSLDQMPSGLGLAGSAGTLDASGNTTDGTPAPIAGAAELKAAIIKTAFEARRGDPPRLIEAQTPSVGGTAYFALVLEDIIPSATRAYDEVAERVRDDWTFDQQRRTQEQAAAAMLVLLKDGKSFSDAATIAGVQPRITSQVTPEKGAEDVPPELQRVLFGLKPGEPTMQETPDGFIVAVPAEIIDPDPKEDAARYDMARKAVARTVAGDLVTVFAEALRQRAAPDVNQKNYDLIVQP